MKRKGISKHARVAKQAIQIASLAPGIAVARMARIASTGDYKALNEMGAEKAVTFTSATVGMMLAGTAVFTKSAFAFANAWSPWGGTSKERISRIQSAMADASSEIVSGALAPIRKRVVANSKRLGR